MTLIVSVCKRKTGRHCVWKEKLYLNRRRLPSFQLLSTDENSSNEDNKENEDHN